MRTLRSTLIVLIAILLLASLSYADRPIKDPEPVNFQVASVFWENRDFEDHTEGPIPMSIRNGQLINAYAFIRLGDYLSDYEAIISVTVSNSSQPGLKWSMDRDLFFYDGLQAVNYYWFFRPDSWCWSGLWTFTLKYTGWDGLDHIQVYEWRTPEGYNLVPTKTYPYVPQHISIIKGAAGFEVTWQGIGDPYVLVDGWRPTNYFVRIFSDYGVYESKAQRFRGTWEGGPGGIYKGTFSRLYNLVTFVIPYSWTFWDGETIDTYGKFIRLESYVGGNRGAKQLRLPTE